MLWGTVLAIYVLAIGDEGRGWPVTSRRVV